MNAEQTGATCNQLLPCRIDSEAFTVAAHEEDPTTLSDSTFAYIRVGFRQDLNGVTNVEELEMDLNSLPKQRSG